MKKTILASVLIVLLLTTGCSSKKDIIKDEATNSNSMKENTVEIKEQDKDLNISDGDLSIQSEESKKLINEILKNGIDTFDLQGFFNREDLTDGTKIDVMVKAFRIIDEQDTNGVGSKKIDGVKYPSIIFNGYVFDDYIQFKDYILADFDEELVKNNQVYVSPEFNPNAEAELETTLTEEKAKEEAATIAKAEAEKAENVEQTKVEKSATTVTNGEKIDQRTVSIESGTYLSEERQITVFGSDKGVVDIALADSYDDKNLDLRSFDFAQAYKNSDGSISITKTSIGDEQLTIYPNGTGFKLNDEIFYRVANGQAYTKLGFDYINYHNQNYVDNWYYDLTELYKGNLIYIYDYGNESEKDDRIFYQVSKIEEVLDSNGHNYTLKYTAKSSEGTEEFMLYFDKDKVSD